MGYNFGTSYPTTDWDAAQGSTDLDVIIFGLNEEDALLPEFGCGTDGVNTFTLHINTSSTVDGSNYIRDSAWRKAYRFINRFDLGTINMDRKLKGKSESQATYKVSRSFATTTNSFELPIDHKPPCRFPHNNASNPTGSRPNIEMIYSMTPIGGAGNVDDAVGVDWSIGSTGLRLIENSTPESIEFTLLKAGTAPNQSIDTSTSIIPAYSGEILSFQDVGYMGNMQSGGVKIFVDITQTDEILRWDSEEDPDRLPHEYWLDSFSSIQVKNVTKNIPALTFKKKTLVVESNDKDNYIVSFTSSSVIPITTWLNGDIIRTEFKRKKTIVFGDERAPWEGAVYENIRYRSLADEFRDDPWVQSIIEPPIETGACCTNGVCEQKTAVECSASGGQFFGVGSTDCPDCGDDGGTESSEILPFTVTLNGTLDAGTITINYPDGVNATGITFEVYIEKDPNPLGNLPV